MRRFFHSTVLCFALYGATAFAGDAGDANNAVSLTVGIMPVTDLTGESRSATILDSLIEVATERAGFVVVGEREFRKTLRKHRIRPAVGVSEKSAAQILEDTEIDLLLISAAEVFTEGANPEVAFSARLLDIRTLRIVWMVCPAGSGSDYSGLFGIGHISSAEKLCRKLVQSAFKNLSPKNLTSKEDAETGGPLATVALVPFDNLSVNRHADRVVGASFVNELLKRGIEVVEPGRISEAMRTRGRLPSGEIDLEMVSELHDKFDIDFVLTGTVDRFNPALPDAESTSPRIEGGARLIDATSGRIVSTSELSLDGRETERLFGTGVCYSLGKLTGHLAARIVGQLNPKKHKHQIADGS